MGPYTSPRQQAAPTDTRVPEMVGISTPIGILRDLAAGIAARRSTVMILGETGTGKEMLARHIHANSDRTDGPFIPVDCSALTETLFESQLFGHVRGAFTGAIRESLGFIRAADQGTLFLDEIGELPLSMQSKLLRVIQERQVVPVGDTRPRAISIRLICATHRDLREMVRNAAFREDLFFRLNVIQLHVPPLRERIDDVIVLAEHFLRGQAELYDEPVKSLSSAAKAVLRAHRWPGNVRELANAMEHAHVIASGRIIDPQHLPDRLTRQPGENDPNDDLRLEQIERRAIAEALRRTRGRKLAACRLLGINIQRLNRRMRRLGLQPPQHHR